jgi:hypothetical protein
MARWKPASPVPVWAAARALSPVSFGADPTCSTDASSAFDALTAALLKLTVGNLTATILDLGGAVVDLQGGCYLLSRPFSVPEGFGNFHVTFGELRAAPSFPPSGSLVNIGDPSSCSLQACNENIAFSGCVVAARGGGMAGGLARLSLTALTNRVPRPPSLPLPASHLTARTWRQRR